MKAFDPEQFPQILTRRSFLKESALLAGAITGAELANTELARAAAPSEPSPTGPVLFLPPLLSRPTPSSIRLGAFNDKLAAEAVLEFRKEGAASWERHEQPVPVSPYKILDWTLRELSPAARYEYQVMLRAGSGSSWRPAAAGSFRTQRKGPASYTAVLITDPHTGYFPPGSRPVLTLDQVVRNAARAKPEFVLDLGDSVAWGGSREFPQKDSNGALNAYAQYRKQLGPLSLHAPHFTVIGNWSGESGKFPEKSIEIAATVRQALLPGPNDLTYPQGGSEKEDYYAFSWGDALFVILNIQTYSKPSDLQALPTLMADVNHPTEWTLGEKQMRWLEATLAQATERFRFVCMHHPAGGNAGDSLNTTYGRGGARAYNVGEQAKIHSLMKKHQVQIFFYGHDHVFVDDVVDGIHYTLPGSCGAPWKFTKEETGYDRFWPDSGHAQLEVTPEKATVTFVNLEGKPFHSFSVRPVS